MEDIKNGVPFATVLLIRTRNVICRRVICEDSSTVVDCKNSEKHEKNCVVNSTTVDCKSCCFNAKIKKKV